MTFAQQANSKVKQALTSSEIAKLNSKEIDYMNFLSENLVIISTAPEKANSFQDFSSIARKDGKPNDIKAIDWNNFNPLLYILPIAKDKVTGYKVGETGKVITVLSQDRLDVLFKRYQSNHSKN